ncbi:MAG TPA: cofactor assembly of complex C subunit B [Thermosynechococcaceae cyanobacterium]
MSYSVLSSTLLLTLLMLVGLIFFIRASVKDRIQVLRLSSAQPEEVTLQSLQEHFADRAYWVAAVDPGQKQIALEGNVRPSLALAIFLSGLAAIGMLCLSLVLSMLLPQLGLALLGLVLLSPIAGIFYWRRAGRAETVLIQVEPEESPSAQSTIRVTAHRDELAELQRAFPSEVLQ